VASLWLLPWAARALLVASDSKAGQVPGVFHAGVPKPPPPSEDDVKEAAKAAVQHHAVPSSVMPDGENLVTGDLAKMAAAMANNEMPGEMRSIMERVRNTGPSPQDEGFQMSMPAGFQENNKEVTSMRKDVAKELKKHGLETTPVSPRPKWSGPKPPPPCEPPPPKLTEGDVNLGLAPFKPPGIIGTGYATKDGGIAWRTELGGWAYQYPDMAARVEKNGKTYMAWAKKQYAVEISSDGVSYHMGDTVVHKSYDGNFVYHQPTGSVHQDGDTTIYHFCKPNVVVYKTPSGIIYYDQTGMTYRSIGAGTPGIAHYSPNGDILYQGPSGVTYMKPTGDVAHWTSSGVIYRHPDGMILYTPTDMSTPRVLNTGALGKDPFPGPPLSMEEVLALAGRVEQEPPPPSSPVPAPGPSPAPAPAQ